MASLVAALANNTPILGVRLLMIMVVSVDFLFWTKHDERRKIFWFQEAIVIIYQVLLK
jgi:hypothetical protein